MGDEVNNRLKAKRRWLPTLLAVGAAVWLSGCASSEPARAMPSPATAPDVGASQAPSAPAPAPLEILSVDVREGAPGDLVDVEANGPVVWTSFRDAQGKLVVELPNSRPGSQVKDLHPAEGLVASVDVESETRAGKPVTSLHIDTRKPADHALSAQGQHLEVRLSPVESTGEGALSYEPLPQDEPPSSEQVAELEPSRVDSSKEVEQAGSMAAAPEPTGTPDQPVAGPSPTGVEATRLDGVQVVSSGPGTVVRVVGDGEFRYSFFSLENPSRFVIDLSGVVNRSSRATVPIGSSVVDRVRMAQFKPAPEPVSRVVFDLEHGDVPRLESTSDGLLVRFGGGSEAAAVPPPVPVTEARRESMPEATPEQAAAGTGGTMARPEGFAAQGTMPAEPPATPPQEPAMKPEEGGVGGTGETVAEPAMTQAAPVQPAQMGETAPAQGAGQEPAGNQAPPTTKPSPPPAQTEPMKPAPVPPASSELDLFREKKVTVEKPTPSGDEAATKPAFGAVKLSTGESKYSGEPIDMSVRDADVVEVLRMFSEISGLNIVVQPGVTGTVTVELKNVPWDQALELILKSNGLGYEIEGNVMRIAPNQVLQQEAVARQKLAEARSLSRPLTTVIKRLSYSNAAAVASLLSARGGILSQRGSIIVDPRTNTMIIKELPEYMDTVIAVIDNLDTPEPQVMIEARIIETTKRFTRTLGINWGFNGTASAELGNTTGLVFPNNVQSSGQVNLLTGGDNGFLSLSMGNLLNSFNLDVALQAAEGEGLINILSAPKVATLNNERATIQSGLQIPIQTVANNTVTTQFVNATLELSVTPQVTAEGTILMDIQIAKREPQFAFALPNAPTAPIATKEARTRVIVRDGGTTVIGGIYEVSTDQGTDKVPGLANIPIIGHLFKNKRRTDENQELLIFITPRVIKL